jgi:4-hydroxy-tetrahydrodipicolinate reductase
MRSVASALGAVNLSRIKVALYGLGAIGLGIAETLLTRPWVELVGAIDSDPSKVGKDVGELLGRSEKVVVKVGQDSGKVLSSTTPEVVIHATSSFLREIRSQLIGILQGEASVISTAEELSYPFVKYPQVAHELDELAKAKRRVILGTGINPGYVLDTLPIVLSGVCRKVNSIRGERVVDASRRRFSLQKKIGAGLQSAEFERRVSAGTLGHVGLPESVGLISLAMGWKLGEIQERITPVIAERNVQSDFMKVEAGQVAGIRQVAKGILAGQELVVLDLRMYLGAQNPHDSILIDGVPPVDVTVRGGFQGDSATAGVVVNSVPRILTAPPGLRTMVDLPPISPRTGLAEEDRSVILKTF